MKPDLYHQMLPIFLQDGERRLEEIDIAIIELQRDPYDGDALARLAHASHILKSNAASLGMRAMVVEAQRIEWWATDVPPRMSRMAVATLHDARGELRRLFDEVAADAEPLV